MSSATPDESGLAALTRIQRVHGQPGDRYEVIFVDQNGQPVIPLTEWYRLRASYGPVTTRETYLTCLLPFLTFLIEQGCSWNAPPNQLRTALAEFYRDRLGCLIQPRKDRDGIGIVPTRNTPLRDSTLRVLRAALRDFYLVLREEGLYAFANPLSSERVVALKRIHVQALANRGVPNHAGIREETHEQSRRLPTAFVRYPTGKAWEPELRKEVADVREGMHKVLDAMIDSEQVPIREKAVLELLQNTGARLHEIVLMTVGGFKNEGIEATHGGSIPVVQPSENTKKEDLSPEPYLFQWDASADGRLGLLTPRDVGHLLRFLFHGLTMTTRTGKPIRVAPHLLRHILATYARHVKKVPAEAVAYLLHHRVTLADSTRTLSISEATAYYSLMPLEQLLALLFEAQATLTTHRGRSYLQAPTPRTLEEMDAALRHIFEQWSLIGPTALGHCSAGLCIRPDNRALCLNCQYLVPHYSNLPKARTWRKLYVLQTQMHDAQGHSIDAQQSRQMVHYLDDIMNLMQIQIRARQDGGYLPFADTLPPAQDEEGEL